MNAPQLLIVADDLTGAADKGGGFARAGLSTLARFAPGPSLPADVLALSTHSRHLPGAEAALRVREAVEQALASCRPARVYKKIDSTLRGNPAAELQAVMEALGIQRALIAPAFPEQGRTTLGGRQQVHGQPLEQTSFGSSSDLMALFRETGRPVRLLSLEIVRRGVEKLGAALGEQGLFVGDALSSEDLRFLARAAVAAGIRLACGSAGLARALQAEAPMSPVATEPLLPPLPAGPVLIAAGSRNPVAVNQVQRAGQEGALVCGPEASEQAVRALAAGRDVVLSIADLEPGDPVEVAQWLGRAVRTVVEKVPVGGLVLTGGDTALAVGAALESSALWLRGEVEPGLPWGRLADGVRPGLPAATKAGGFGTGEALAAASRFLKDRR